MKPQPPAMDFSFLSPSSIQDAIEEEANERSINLGAESPALYSPCFSPTVPAYHHHYHEKEGSPLHEYLREEIERVFLESPLLTDREVDSSEEGSEESSEGTGESSSLQRTSEVCGDNAFLPHEIQTLDPNSNSNPNSDADANHDPNRPVILLAPSPRKPTPTLLLNLDFEPEREQLSSAVSVSTDTTDTDTITTTSTSGEDTPAEEDEQGSCSYSANLRLSFPSSSSLPVVGSGSGSGRIPMTKGGTVRMRSTKENEKENLIAFPSTSQNPEPERQQPLSPSISSRHLRPFPSSPLSSSVSFPSSSSTLTHRTSNSSLRPSTPLALTQLSPGYAEVELNDKVASWVGSVFRILGFVVVLYGLFGVGK